MGERMENTVLIPGSFDPVTIGHIDVIERAAAIYDNVIVCVFSNNSKKCMFSPQMRFELLKASLEKYPNVKADISCELLAEYAQRHACRAIVKGLRNASDFDYEFMLCSINRELAPDIETIFMPTRAELAHISSTMVRELIRYGRDFSHFVPKEAVNIIKTEDKKIY